MQPSRRHCIYASLVVLGLLLPVTRAFAETFKVTSTPSGATIEVDGSVAGTTPFQIEYPSGYFHKTHTVFGSKIEHSLVLRISKDGYLSQQVTLTEGPYEWVSVNGHHHGNYFLLKSAHFEIKLEPTPVAGNALETINKEGPLRPPHTATTHMDESVSPQETGSVLISSDPSGAEIFIDGKFAGQ